MNKSTCAGLLWLLTASGAAQAAYAPTLVLEHLGIAEGLPQGTVNATLQDSQGFVWLGTEDGLVRYDGHDLVRYAYSRTAGGGLPGNFIRDIVEDSHHDLWIAVKDAGLARWNRATDSFTVYRHDPANPGSLASDVTRVVRVDARGRVWVGMSHAGIDVLDPASGRIEHFRHDPSHADSLGDDQILTLTIDRAGAVWAGTAAGLERRQAASGAFIHFHHSADDPHTLDGSQVSQVVEDRSGSFWVGTFDGGLSRLDRDGIVRETWRHDPQRATSLGGDDVHAILEDRAGHLWVGTAEGLDLLDRSTGEFTHYRHDARDPGSLRDSSMMSLYEDTTGLVWIGTQEGGVSRWNPRSWQLGGQRPDWLDGQSVTAFADAPNHKVWISSMGGLVQFDAASGETAGIDSIVGRRDAVGDRRVMALHLDRHDTLWIGTMTSGLRRLSPNGELQSIAVEAGDPHSVSGPGIMTIFESRDGHLWIGTHGHGANVLDPDTGLIRQLPFEPDAAGAISAASVTAIAEDQQGNMWLGTESGGLDLARADGTVTKVFRHDPKDPASIPSNTIFAIAVDALGRVWIATDGGGLARVLGSAASPDAIRFAIYGREEGLSSDTIYGVLSDAAGRLWLSGDAGLMRFDPDTHAVKTFHREHGLQGEEFNYGAYHQLRDGRLCFGGPGGFNIFDAAQLTENSKAPRVALTRLEVLGAAAPSATPYWLLDRIGLNYQASIVSLEFATLDFTSPKRNRLAYRVAGLSDRWIDIGGQHRVTLTNLDAGDHLLEVRAANADSVWSDPPLRLTIHRDPAPWRSPWAYAAYALALLLLALDRVRRQRAAMRQMVDAKRRLESEVALRTRELVESNRQLAEAAQAKSNFLARISHELRTPLNGVVGMTELLGRSVLSSTQARLTQTIRSSAQLLMHIVNDLLDLSKLQAGKVELEALPLDLGLLLEECASMFAAAAEAKGIELTVCPPADNSANLVGDPLRIRQVLINLLGNAVKFTQRGAVVVKADIEAAAAGRSLVRMTVADTGVGMNAAAIAKIFEPFTQADESTTRRFGGTGLGLAICRELAERMGGTVTVESQPNVGSTFCFSVPLETAAVAAAPATAAALRVSGQASEAAGEASQAAAHAVQGAGEASQAAAHALQVEGHALQGAAGLPLTPASESSHPLPGPLMNRGHVLLVEDEPVNAAVAHGYLVELGCSCVWVENGLEAVARSAAERFDLIMMDLNMPLMDGFATTKLIRQREGTGDRVPIIALTAHDEKNYGEACRHADMDDLMSKPYTLDQCARLLDRWLAAAAKPAGPVPAAVDDESAQEQSASPAWPPSAPDGDAESLTCIDARTVTALQGLHSGANADLYSRLVRLFQSASQAALLDLQSALRLGDLKAAGAVCHKFAASAANVGALMFARELRLLEQICGSGDGARAQRLYSRLLAAHPALLDELSRIETRASA